jgi:hypothetical protein
MSDIILETLKEAENISQTEVRDRILDLVIDVKY